MAQSKIRFVTDSAADIPAELRQALGIQVLPFMIAMGERELRDGEELTATEFYEALVSAPRIPTHSQLTPITLLECYEEAWQAGYTDLIYTAINAKASATWQNALLAREQFFEAHPGARDSFDIHVIDSAVYTMGYGFAVVQGARMAAAGADAAAVVAFIQDWTAHVRVVFAPYDLRFAKKSGRVSAAAAFMGEALGLKPIMTFAQGESQVLSKVRGEKNVIPAIVERCLQERVPGTPYLCIGGSLPERNRELCAAATAALGEAPALEYLIGGVIAINAGPNVVGLIYRR